MVMSRKRGRIDGFFGSCNTCHSCRKGCISEKFVPSLHNLPCISSSEALFERRLKYGIAVLVSRNPDLNTYIREIIDG